MSIAICVFDDKRDRIVVALNNYLQKEEKHYKICSDKFKFFKDFEKKSELPKYEKFKDEMESIMATWENTLNKAKKIVILLDFELYVGENYNLINNMLKEHIISYIKEYSENHNSQTFYLFMYTSVKENDQFNYIIDNRKMFEEKTTDNFKIYREGLRILYNRELNYSYNFDMILQTISMDEKEFWYEKICN